MSFIGGTHCSGKVLGLPVDDTLVPCWRALKRSEVELVWNRFLQVGVEGRRWGSFQRKLV